METNKQATQKNLVVLLNPIIAGWTNYHRHIVAKETFAYIDHQIWHLLWNWAKRRHPNKRHIKIKGDANPFDPKRTEYFEKRSRLKP